MRRSNLGVSIFGRVWWNMTSEDDFYLTKTWIWSNRFVSDRIRYIYSTLSTRSISQLRGIDELRCQLVAFHLLWTPVESKRQSTIQLADKKSSGWAKSALNSVKDEQVSENTYPTMGDFSGPSRLPNFVHIFLRVYRSGCSFSFVLRGRINSHGQLHGAQNKRASPRPWWFRCIPHCYEWSPFGLPYVCKLSSVEPPDPKVTDDYQSVALKQQVSIC